MRARKTIAHQIAALAGLGLGLSLGCLQLEPNLGHCSYQQGDATCEALYPGEKTFCSWGIGSCGPDPAKDGCVATRPSDECYSPCGGDELLMENSSCLELAGTSTSTEDGTSTMDSEASTTEAVDASESSTTGPVPCVGNGDCSDPAEPFCEPVSGECVTCAATDDPDGACAELDPSAPLCVEGTCVQCTAAAPEACMGETPVCDDATHTCVPCTEHGQCGGAACNLFTGACLPVDAVVHVGPGETYDTITEAVGSFAEGAAGTIVVHQDAYNEAVTVDGGRVLALLANDGDLPLWILAPSTTPQLVVGDATVLMDGIQISGNASSMHPGVRIDDGRAWLDRSRVIGNDGGGILVQNDAELVLRNCFVGGDVSDQAAVSVDASGVEVLYSTLGAGFGEAASLTCSGASTVEVRNSVFVARTDADEIQCSIAAIDHSATEMDLGGTNTALGAMATAWFMGFGSGDFHLVPGAPLTIATTARWELGDPGNDIDGEDRPQIDGAPDVAGADVP